VEHEEVAHLGRLDHDGERAAVARELGERRLGRDVVVPEIVVHDLEVPDDGPGAPAQRDHRVRVATSSPSPDYYGGERPGSNRYEGEVALRVDRERRPPASPP
jgi:hypothetical protein